MDSVDNPYEYVTAWIGRADWTPEMVGEYLQACAYWQGRADERALADAELARTLTAVFGGDEARTLHEAMGRHIRGLDALAARRRAAASPPPSRPQTGWPDAIVRIPGESPQHYDWRCRRAATA